MHTLAEFEMAHARTKKAIEEALDDYRTDVKAAARAEWFYKKERAIEFRKLAEGPKMSVKDREMESERRTNHLFKDWAEKEAMTKASKAAWETFRGHQMALMNLISAHKEEAAFTRVGGGEGA